MSVRKTSVPMAFVILALLALVIVPIWTQSEVESARKDMLEVAKPARILIGEIQLSLAQEMSALRGFLLTGGEEFLERHRQALDREDRASTQLQGLSARLGPSLAENLLELHAAELGWRLPAAELLNRRLHPRLYLEQLPAQEELYEKALGVVNGLDEDVRAREAADENRIRRAERLQAVLTGALALMALAAAVAVASLTARLRALATRAEAAVRARDEVLAIVSHDLRSPLNTISISSSLLLADPDPTEQGRQVDVIERSIEQMNRLIQDLLDVARIEAGRLAVEPHPVEPVPLVRDAADSLRPLAAEKGLKLEADVPAQLPPIAADRGRILQVLSNLVGNAIKATDHGGRIVLGAGRKERDVHFWVADTGSGIDKDHVAHLFDPYWQARRTGRQGAGLGLFITRGIILAHGGRIWVESAPGEGSRFHFTLPVANPSSN